jgi:hypothetical protein
MKRFLPSLVAAPLFALFTTAAIAASSLKQIGESDVPEAFQGVAVDDRYFYAVHDRAIGNYDRRRARSLRDGRVPRMDPSFILTARR